MAEQDWKKDLRSCFDDLQVIDRCRSEAVGQFDKFCEYVVEPAFEALIEEFLRHEIKCRTVRIKGSSIQLEVKFPRSKEDHFHYSLWLPKHVVELKMKLTLRCRKAPGGPMEEKTMAFIAKAPAAEILRIDKDALAQDVVARYKKFLYETAVISE